MSLKRDMKRYIRDNTESTFADAKKEALRWMMEDSCLDTATEQLAVPNHDGLQRLETQIAALLTETASLRFTSLRAAISMFPTMTALSGWKPKLQRSSRRPLASGLLR